MTVYHVEFGPAWPVPPLTVDADTDDEFTRAVAEHAIPHLRSALEQKGRSELADCFFRTSKDRTTGEFMWLDFESGRAARFCAARITTVQPVVPVTPLHAAPQARDNHAA